MEPAQAPEPQLRLVIRLPGRYMDRLDAQQAPISDEMDATPSDDIGLSTPRPRHDVSYVPDYPVRSLRSSLKHDGRRGGCYGLERDDGGGGSAMLVVDSAEYPPVTFSAGLPGGFQLSQVPDHRNVCEAMAAPDADSWSDAMSKEMDNLKSYDVYEMVPRVPGMRTLRLGWFSTASSRTASLRRTRPD